MPGVRICAHTWVCVTFQRNDILSRANIIIVGLNGRKDSRVLVTAAWSSVKHIQVAAVPQWKKDKLCDHYVQYWNVKSSGHKRSVDIDPPQCWRGGAVGALNPKSETYIPSIYHLYTCMYTRRPRERKSNAKRKTSHWNRTYTDIRILYIGNFGCVRRQGHEWDPLCWKTKVIRLWWMRWYFC